MRTQSIARLATLVLAVAALWAAACSGPPPDPYGAKVGDEAPPFTVNSMSGGTLSFESYRGQPVLIYFWASWCGSCTFDLPDIESISAASFGSDLVTITINVGEEPEFVEQYVREAVGDYTFVSAADLSLDTFRRYRVLSFPSTFFIDRDGVIREMIVGRVTQQTLNDGLATIL